MVIVADVHKVMYDEIDTSLVEVYEEDGWGCGQEHLLVVPILVLALALVLWVNWLLQRWAINLFCHLVVNSRNHPKRVCEGRCSEG